MSWIVLVISGLLEAVWATALSRSEGLTNLTPSIVFGAATTVAWAMLTGAEPVSVVRVLLIAGLIAIVIGLGLTH